MPDDTNRHIDELLKAYAEKRRKDAGAPELHPATRKMLQAEAAKLAAEPEPESPPRPAFWERVRPAIAFALLFAIVITVSAVWLRIHASRPEQLVRNNQSNEPARDRGSPLPSAAPAPASKAEAPERAFDTTGHKEPLAYSTPSKPAAPVAAAPAPAAVRGELAVGQAGSAVESKAVAADTLEAASSERAKLLDKSVAFSRTQNVATQRYVRQGTSGGAGADGKQQAFESVLSSFQVEQRGNSVRIVDADGSTYAGAVVAPGAVGSATFGMAESSGITNAATVTANVQSARPSQQSLQFRATGTNRSLNQVVVFEGNLITETNAPQAPVTQLKSASKQDQLGTANLRIQGRAIVGGKDEITIDAVPVK